MLIYAAALRLQRNQATNSALRVMGPVLYLNSILLVILALLTPTPANSVEKAHQILNGVHDLASEMRKRVAKRPSKNAFVSLLHLRLVFGAVVMAIFTILSMDAQHTWRDATRRYICVNCAELPCPTCRTSGRELLFY